MYTHTSLSLSIYIYIYTHTYTHIHIYIYTYKHKIGHRKLAGQGALHRRLLGPRPRTRPKDQATYRAHH